MKLSWNLRFIISILHLKLYKVLINQMKNGFAALLTVFTAKLEFS